MQELKPLVVAGVVLVVGVGSFFGGTQYQASVEAKKVALVSSLAGQGDQGGKGGGQYSRSGQMMGGRNPGSGSDAGLGKGTGNTSGRMMGGNRPIVGDIISADDKSITVKLLDGSSKIVLLSTTSELTKTASATKTDLVAGAKVGVFGTTNADGSVTAQTIQLNPTFGTQSR